MGPPSWSYGSNRTKIESIGEVCKFLGGPQNIYIIHHSIRIFNANPMLLLSLQSSRNWLCYFTNSKINPILACDGLSYIDALQMFSHPHIEMKRPYNTRDYFFFGQSLKMRFRISEIPNIKENYKKLTNLISNKADLRDAQLGLFVNWRITNLSPSTYFEAIKAYDTRDHFRLVWA